MTADPDAADPDLVPLAELAARTTVVAANWEMIKANTVNHATEIVTNDGWRVPRMLVIAQALHHAEQHRTQVLSITGAREFDMAQDFDLWQLGIENGMMQKVGGENAS